MLLMPSNCGLDLYITSVAELKVYYLSSLANAIVVTLFRRGGWVEGTEQFIGLYWRGVC